MSILDTEISTTVWTGKLPIKIELDPSEVDIHGNIMTQCIYLEVRSCSYLPMITREIQTILNKMGAVISEDKFQKVWYDYNGQPLKWHYPLALLHDIHSPPNMPWSITLHFNNLPTDILLKDPTMDNMQDVFMSMIKEADYLRHGSTKKVMNMSKRDQTQLWESVITDQCDTFWTVNRHLVDSIPIKNIPLRIYLSETSPVIQELVSAEDASDEDYTIGSVIMKMIPPIAPLIDSISILLHGVEIPPETPIEWACTNLIYLDNFLHVVLRYKE
ncbi:autophagy protein Apg5-domain-containing protein [Pilobolus umbonatus]|nr:autophagy protein Apg5-domain-containing protein [Pilobolus umbonatus]